MKYDDLVAFTAPLTAKLPITESDNDFHLSSDALPVLPEVLETSGIVIKRGIHDYNGSWRIDHPQAYADKNVYEALGMITACVLLSPQRDQLEIQLTHPASDIKSLVVEFSSARYLFGLRSVPVEFLYEVESVGQKPWSQEAELNPYTFPQFELTNKQRSPITEDDWLGRDVIYGFGSAEGTARLIRLFLDMSRPGNNTSEFLLESEAGFRGVSPLSAEIRFWLPGGDGWIDF